MGRIPSPTASPPLNLTIYLAMVKTHYAEPEYIRTKVGEYCVETEQTLGELKEAIRVHPNFTGENIAHRVGLKIPDSDNQYYSLSSIRNALKGNGGLLLFLLWLSSSKYYYIKIPAHIFLCGLLFDLSTLLVTRFKRLYPRVNQEHWNNNPPSATMNTNNGNGTNPNNGDHQDGRARFRFRPNEHNAPNGVPFSPTPGSHSRTTPRTPLFAGAPRPPPGQNQPQPQQAPPHQQFPHAHASSTYVHQASSPHQHPSQEGGGGQYGYGQEMFSPGRTFGGSMPHVQAPASHHCGGGGVQPGHRMFSPDAHAPTYASHGGGWHQDGMPPSVIHSHSNVEDRTLASGVSNLSLKTVCKNFVWKYLFLETILLT